MVFILVIATPVTYFSMWSDDYAVSRITNNNESAKKQSTNYNLNTNFGESFIGLTQSQSYKITIGFFGASKAKYLPNGLPSPEPTLIEASAQPPSVNAGETSNITALIIDARYTDQRPVPNVQVNFQVTAGGGSLEVINGTSDENGYARARLTTGPNTAENKIKITVQGQTLIEKTVIVNGYKAAITGSITGTPTVGSSFINSQYSPALPAPGSLSGYKSLSAILKEKELREKEIQEQQEREKKQEEFRQYMLSRKIEQFIGFQKSINETITEMNKLAGKIEKRREKYDMTVGLIGDYQSAGGLTKSQYKTALNKVGRAESLAAEINTMVEQYNEYSEKLNKLTAHAQYLCDEVEEIVCDFNPVNTFNGNLIYTVRDLFLPSRGMSLQLSRTYNSFSAADSPFGYGWTFSYDMYLKFIDADNIVFHRGDGAEINYLKQQDGTFKPAIGNYSNLIENTDNSYTLTEQSGMKFKFSVSGKLTQLVDRNNNTITLTYTDGKLTKITDTTGRETFFQYNLQGRISKLIDPASRETNYTYNENGDLTQVTGPGDFAATYAYDSNHLMIERNDPNCDIKKYVKRKYEYDENNRVITEIDGLNNRFTIQYDLANRITIFTDAKGNQTQFQYDALCRLISQTNADNNTKTYSWDSNNNNTSVTDYKGEITQYTYDIYGNEASATDPLGKVRSGTWDIYGNPLTVTDPKGNTTTFTYDNNGNLIEIEDALDSTIQYSYNSYGQKTSVTDKNNHTSTYEYDQYGNNNIITDPQEGSTNLTYDVIGRLTGVTDPLNRTMYYNYDNRNRITKIINSDATEKSFTYDINNNILSITDENSNVTYFAYDANNLLLNIEDPLHNNTVYTYDELGRKITVKDSKNNTASFTYDKLDRITTVTDALNNQTSFAYDKMGNQLSVTDARGKTTSFEYDAIGKMLTKTDANGKNVLYEYDSAGCLTGLTDQNNHKTTYEYNALNRMIKIIDPLNGQTINNYDNAGNITSITDANGNATLYEYDSLNRLVKIKDALDNETHFTYDAVGNKLSVVDANNRTVLYEYNSRNRLVEVTDTKGGISTYEYDNAGNRTAFTDALNHETNYQYDDLNRLTKTIDALSNQTDFTYDTVGNLISKTDANNNVTQFEYDVLNRLTKTINAKGKTTQLLYDAVGNKTAVIDAKSNLTAFEYDNLNRLTKITDPLNNQTIYAYDFAGNRTTIMDANSKTTNYEYDALNRLTKVTDANSKSTSYEYDAVGNRLSLTDAKGNKTTYEYNALNKIVQEEDPLNKTVQYQYNAVGNLIAKIDGNDNTISYAYDNFDQLTQQTYPDQDVSNYTYNAVGNRTRQYNQNADVSYGYDSLNRLITVTQSFPGTNLGPKVVQHAYDAVGNRTSVTYPDNKVTTFAHNEINQTTQINDADSGIISYEYDDVGNKTKATYSNGIESDYVYNVNNWLFNIEHKNTLTGVMVSSFGYTYDNVGNKTNTVDGYGKTDYIYDNLYELTKVTFPEKTFQEYYYDPVGNRTKFVDEQGVINYQYNNANELTQYLVNRNSTQGNQGGLYDPGIVTVSTGAVINLKTGISAVTLKNVTVDYEYDGNGSQVQKTVKNEGSTMNKEYNYQYDYENRLVKVIFPDNSYEKYLYAPNGKRVAVQKWQANASQPEETTYFVYDALQCNNVYEISGSSVSRYVYLWPGNEMLSKVVTTSDLPLMTYGFYYHYDSLGSVSAITNSSGTVTNTYRYDPFGNVMNSTGKNGRYSFVGAFGVENDGMSGLFHMGARYYDPTIGRFIQRDSVRGFIDDPLTLNRYIYCGNNPINYIDPKGYGKLDLDENTNTYGHGGTGQEYIEKYGNYDSNDINNNNSERSSGNYNSPLLFPLIGAISPLKITIKIVNLLLNPIPFTVDDFIFYFLKEAPELNPIQDNPTNPENPMYGTWELDINKLPKQDPILFIPGDVQIRGIKNSKNQSINNYDCKNK